MNPIFDDRLRSRLFLHLLAESVSGTSATRFVIKCWYLAGRAVVMQHVYAKHLQAISVESSGYRN